MPKKPKQINLTDFEFTPKQISEINHPAPYRLSVGGVRSGKTMGALMYGIIAYCLAFKCCDILVLRRTFPDLEAGAISDMRAVVPRELYDWHEAKHIATFKVTGSKVYFGHCKNNQERDIGQYLGRSYPFILVDECVQFSPDAWEIITSRNTINPECQPDANGEFPIPCTWACTNPIGTYWPYYRAIFIEKRPYEKEEGVKRDDKGRYWKEVYGKWIQVYDPEDYSAEKSTVYDNPYVLKRDPGIVERLQRLPEARRKKLLEGQLTDEGGQYFDCWDPDQHVVDLKEDPEAIIWQPEFQPVWGGWDWGMGHWNTFYAFTKALVRPPGKLYSVEREPDLSDYKLKTVCFAEIVTKQKEYTTMVSMISRIKCPWDRQQTIKPRSIYFSHEKFKRQITFRSPADEISQYLLQNKLCAVTPGTIDRVGSAAYVYQVLKKGELVITSNCTEIIKAVPILQSDPTSLDDVEKTATKEDDCYDGFRHGVFGELAPGRESKAKREMSRIRTIKDPFIQKLELMKLGLKDIKKPESDRTKTPMWMAREDLGLQKTSAWQARLEK
jgi:hypothetical protein